MQAQIPSKVLPRDDVFDALFVLFCFLEGGRGKQVENLKLLGLPPGRAPLKQMQPYSLIR